MAALYFELLSVPQAAFGVHLVEAAAAMRTLIAHSPFRHSGTQAPCHPAQWPQQCTLAHLELEHLCHLYPRRQHVQLPEGQLPLPCSCCRGPPFQQIKFAVLAQRNGFAACGSSLARQPWHTCPEGGRVCHHGLAAAVHAGGAVWSLHAGPVVPRHPPPGEAGCAVAVHKPAAKLLSGGIQEQDFPSPSALREPSQVSSPCSQIHPCSLVCEVLCR